MTSITSPLPDLRSGRRPAIAPKLAIALALAAFADWLFYDQRLGLSVVIFAAALMSGSLLANLGRLTQKKTLMAGTVLIAGLVPAVEELNILSLIFVIIALALSVAIMTDRPLTRVGDRFAVLRDLLLVGPFRLILDVVGSLKLRPLSRGIAMWFIPVVFGSVFVFLFASANPLIEKWIGLLNPGDAAAKINPGRAFFWFATLSLIWPFVHIYWHAKKTTQTDPAPTALPESETSSDHLNFFGAAEILRSLILFNLLFAVQTLLDLVYLWGNAKLPADITYADYAHRGAYALIVTALLAASFVLVAMRPGGPGEKSPAIRPLVYLWVAQTIMLVASSILRLYLYVEIYLLTYWRVAAFIWMLLVIIGLVSIVARIALARSNDWLVQINLINLAGTLYICSLLNLSAIIADYNVAHSREAGGNGVHLDVAYLVGLGPQALPAIDEGLRMGLDRRFPELVYERDRLVERQAHDMANWRSWVFRSWWLQRYLDVGARNALSASIGRVEFDAPYPDC